MSKYKKLIGTFSLEDGREGELYQTESIEIKCGWRGIGTADIASYLSAESSDAFYAMMCYMLENYTINELNDTTVRKGVEITNVSDEIADEISALSFYFSKRGRGGYMGAYRPFYSKYTRVDESGNIYHGFEWGGQLNENGEFILESEQEHERIREDIMRLKLDGKI